MSESVREQLRVPAWCPVCDLTMRDNPKTYYKWGCCMLCFIEFIENREERWESGWRPSPEDVARFHSRLHG